MPVSELRVDLTLVFFIYGLAFFSMGLAMLLESRRTPRLAERRLVLPLAVFGLLHGSHEWFEVLLLQSEWLDQAIPAWLHWLRIAWLVLSFIPLALYGGLGLFPSGVIRRRAAYPAAIGLLIFLALGVWGAWVSPEGAVARSDALARYFLAVPGASLAAYGLYRRGLQIQRERRPALAGYLTGAAIGFGLYALTQVFVPPADIFPASLINSAVFSSLAGFPIQGVRAAMAVLVTFNILRAVEYVDREREAQLLAAQQARFDALEQVRQDLSERAALRRQLLRHTVLAQEDERSRIARELHDETAQLLTAITLDLATLRSSLPPERSPASQNARVLIDRLQVNARQMSQGLYRLVHNLRPAQLDDLGLVAALQHLADEERRRSGLDLTLEIEGSRQRLDPLLETVFFRVAQEALSNVIRHSQSSSAVLRVQFNTGQAVLQVVDEGLGFNPNEQLSPPRGWGLAGMRERAESLGGHLEIESEPGCGTQISVVIPLDNQGSGEHVESEAHENHPVNVS